MKPSMFCCRCKQAAGCDACGQVLFSKFVSPVLGGEKEEGNTTEKAELTFGCVLLIVCRAMLIYKSSKYLFELFFRVTVHVLVLHLPFNPVALYFF